jgi:hypothetical protein
MNSIELWMICWVDYSHLVDIKNFPILKFIELPLRRTSNTIKWKFHCHILHILYRYLSLIYAGQPALVAKSTHFFCIVWSWTDGRIQTVNKLSFSLFLKICLFRNQAKRDCAVFGWWLLCALNVLGKRRPFRGNIHAFPLSTQKQFWTGQQK